MQRAMDFQAPRGILKRIALAEDDDDELLSPAHGHLGSPTGSSSSSTSARFEMTLRHQETSGLRSSSLSSPRESSRSARDEDAISTHDIESSAPRREASDMDTEEIIMSVFWRGGKLGAAYYTVETSEIHVLMDVVDVNPEFNILRTFFAQVQPSQVLTSGRLADKFVKTLKSLVGPADAASESEDGAATGTCRLHLLPGKEFKYDACRVRIVSLHLPTEPAGAAADEEAHLSYVHSLLDLSAESSVCALGSLLRFLDRSWCDINLDVTERSAPVLAVLPIALEDIVSIDGDTYLALQIFSPRAHPSNFKRWAPGSSKEGLSVFGVFNRCRSTLGCKYMRVMFLQPTYNAQVLNERLDVVEFCMKQKNAEVLRQMLDCLKHVKSVTRIMTKLQAAQASVREWKTLYKTVYHAVLIGELCAGQDDEISLFRKIADCLTDDLYQVGQCINTFMDFDESEVQNKFVVRPGIDAELDKKKQKHGGLGELLSAVAQQELAQLPAHVPQCSVVYIPEIGYLLGLPMWKQEMTEEDLDLPGLDFMFKANRVAHFKSARCRELDQVLGDSLVHISEHEARIMVRLVQFIQGHLNPISTITNLLAQLDCLASLAAVALEQGYVRPVLSGDNVLEIREGRHPLQELCVAEFVPNDTLSGGEHGKQMKILTGPNACGKSVYLKQVAVITYLAHIGSFVPARSAKIGLLRQVFTRIQTVESIATRLSAFMIDLRQMALALTCSTSRSLVVVDEFGKGTSELDGLALLTACLNNFLERGQFCPHVFVSTHFHHVVQHLAPSPLLQSQTLEHMRDGDHIVYLYKLKDGSVQSSFALQVAQSVGLNQALLDRAIKVEESLRTNSIVERMPTNSISRKIAKRKELGEKIIALNMDDDFSKDVVLRQLIKNIK